MVVKRKYITECVTPYVISTCCVAQGWVKEPFGTKPQCSWTNLSYGSCTRSAQKSNIYMISFNEATRAASRGHFFQTVSVEPDIFSISPLQSICFCVGQWPQTTSSSISCKSGSPENFEEPEKKNPVERESILVINVSEKPCIFLQCYTEKGRGFIVCELISIVRKLEKGWIFLLHGLHIWSCLLALEIDEFVSV